ncbi:unnamed protein product [Umbelopsis ramanniana]
MAKKSGNKKPRTNSFMLLEKGPKWKREQVADHKFDFIDIDEFYDPSCWTKTKYMMIFLSVIKSTLTYLADLWTAGILLSQVDPQMIYKSVQQPVNGFTLVVSLYPFYSWLWIFEKQDWSLHRATSRTHSLLSRHIVTTRSRVTLTTAYSIKFKLQRKPPTILHSLSSSH